MYKGIGMTDSSICNGAHLDPETPERDLASNADIARWLMRNSTSLGSMVSKSFLKSPK